MNDDDFTDDDWDMAGEILDAHASASRAAYRRYHHWMVALGGLAGLAVGLSMVIVILVWNRLWMTTAAFIVALVVDIVVGMLVLEKAERLSAEWRKVDEFQ